MQIRIRDIHLVLRLLTQCIDFENPVYSTSILSPRSLDELFVRKIIENKIPSMFPESNTQFSYFRL